MAVIILQEAAVNLRAVYILEMQTKRVVVEGWWWWWRGFRRDTLNLDSK